MKRIFVVLAVAAVVLFGGCGMSQPVRLSYADTAMGTVIQQNIYTTDRESNVAEEIMTLLRELEEETLSRRLESSEVWAVNQAAERGEEIILSPELGEILKACLDMWRQSEGAFDVTMGQVVELWRIDEWAAGSSQEKFELPEKSLLTQALEQCGSEKIQLKDRRLMMQPDMKLDLGAVGKGIALDRIMAYLEGKEEITGAIISVGGSVLTFGEKPNGSCWRVGITNPHNTSENIGVLSLNGQWCVSTSGNYERFAEADGIRYHHIIDPKTGYPADNDISGVTVLTKDGFLSDALSTACFVLGGERGMELAEKYQAEVLFVNSDGSVEMTEGMKQYYETVQ